MASITATDCANTKSHTIIYQNHKYPTHAPDRTQIRDGSFGRRQVEDRNPLSKGTRVVLFVVRESPNDFSDLNFSDLTKASESTLEFWDNPIDDEEWNDA